MLLTGNYDSPHLFLFLPEDRPKPKTEPLPKRGFRNAGLRLRRFHIISVVNAHARMISLRAEFFKRILAHQLERPLSG